MFNFQFLEKKYISLIWILVFNLFNQQLLANTFFKSNKFINQYFDWSYSEKKFKNVQNQLKIQMEYLEKVLISNIPSSESE